MGRGEVSFCCPYFELKTYKKQVCYKILFGGCMNAREQAGDYIVQREKPALHLSQTWSVSVYRQRYALGV